MRLPPPNIARTVAALSAYVATVTDGALWLHQLADAEIDLPARTTERARPVVTGYPADGRVEIRGEGDVLPGAELSVRIPGWSPRSTVVGPDGARERDGDGYARVPLEPGARYVLDLDLTPRLTTAHHRVNALRAAVAVNGDPLSTAASRRTWMHRWTSTTSRSCPRRSPSASATRLRP